MDIRRPSKINVFPKTRLPNNVQVGIDNLNSEFQQGKANISDLFGKDVPMSKRFAAGVKTAEQIRRVAPMVKESMSKVNSAASSARNAKSKQSQSTSQRTATSTSNNYKERVYTTQSLGASPRPRTPSGNTYNTFEQVNGFNVMNTNGIPTTLSSVKDDSLYENPYIYQSEPVANAPIKVRTVFNVIRPQIFNDQLSRSIYDELYNNWKQQVNEGTNGGTTVTNNVFTNEKVLNYLQKVYNLHFCLVELISRMAWATEDVNSNKSLRKLAFAITDDPQMLVIRNRMASVLSNFVLPAEVYHYPYWLFQVNQTNEYPNSIDQLFMTPWMSGIIDNDGTRDYITVVNSYIDDMLGQSQAELSQISALFQAKTSNNWINLRHVKSPINTTVYDPSWNDVFNNRTTFLCRDNNPNNQYVYPDPVDQTTSIPVVFSTHIDQVQVHVTETYLQRYQNGPLLFIDAWPNQIQQPFAYKNLNNKFLIHEDGNKVVGISTRVRNDHISQIGNDAITVWKTTPDMIAYNWNIKPVGDQYYLYDVSYNAIVLAQRLFAAKMFA